MCFSWELWSATFQVVLSQEDLNVFLKVLTENLGEAEETQTDAKSVMQKEGQRWNLFVVNINCVCFQK